MSLSTSDFLVGPVIGQGSFGRVLYCQHKATQKAVAMKVLDKVSLRKRHALEHAILQEQRLLRNQLRNLQYVVELWASFHDQECLYMVMECLMGGTLQDLIRVRRSRDDWLPQAAAHYGLQILLALQEIHSHNIIHADVSPANVLLTERGRVKLCDFGCAVEMTMAQTKESAAAERSVEDTETPVDMVPRGTCDYASPEIVRGVLSSALTIAVDIWSFGCLLTCLITGESPFSAASEALAVQNVLDYAKETDPTKRHDILFRNAPLPPEWQRLVEPMLAPDPTVRLMGHAGWSPKLDDSWHSRTMADTVWFGGDVDQVPCILPQPPDWLTSLKPEELVDGDKGWSAFLL